MALQIKEVTSDQQLEQIAELANLIWHQHFTPIIGEAQVDYMLEKFQSYPALKEQLSEGYSYFQLFWEDDFCGYCGIVPEEERLFLSKLYVKQDCRGRHIATDTIDFLKGICQEKGLKSIYLTCNKHNDNTLAIYRHLGFTTIDTQEKDIGNGFIMDDYIMELSVSD